MSFLGSKDLHQKICDQAGINSTKGSQAGYFSRDMMARLLVYLQSVNEQIKKLKKMIGDNNEFKTK